MRQKLMGKQKVTSARKPAAHNSHYSMQYKKQTSDESQLSLSRSHLTVDNKTVEKANFS